MVNINYNKGPYNMRFTSFKYSVFSVFLILFCFQFSLAQESGGDYYPSDSLKIVKNARFEISYPDSWRIDQSGVRGSEFILYLPFVGDNVTFSENINLLIQDVSGYDMNLDAYTDLSVNQLKQMFPTTKIITNERKRADGRDYQRMVFTATQKSLDLKFEQRYWIIGTNAYVITATYLESSAPLQEKNVKLALDAFKPLGGK